MEPSPPAPARAPGSVQWSTRARARPAGALPGPPSARIFAPVVSGAVVEALPTGPTRSPAPPHGSLPSPRLPGARRPVLGGRAHGPRHGAELGLRALDAARDAALGGRHLPDRAHARAGRARRLRPDAPGAVRLRGAQLGRLRADVPGARARRLGAALVRFGAGLAR